MATRMCDVCGVRPARVTVRRIVPGGQPRIEHLCEIHAAEARGQRPSLGGPSLGGGSIFDDFFSRFLDAPEGSMSSPTRRTTPSRGAELVDITQFFSDSTSALLQRAAQRAGEWGSVNLDNEHLLHAAPEDGVVRRVVEEVDADPNQIRAQIEEEAERGGRPEVSPELSPEAKRATGRLRGVARVCVRGGLRPGVRGQATQAYYPAEGGQRTLPHGTRRLTQPRRQGGSRPRGGQAHLWGSRRDGADGDND